MFLEPDNHFHRFHTWIVISQTIPFHFPKSFSKPVPATFSFLSQMLGTQGALCCVRMDALHHIKQLCMSHRKVHANESPLHAERPVCLSVKRIGLCKISGCANQMPPFDHHSAPGTPPEVQLKALYQNWLVARLIVRYGRCSLKLWKL